MADRSIVVRLRADISDYSRKMRDAGKATKDAADQTSSWVTKNSSSLNSLSTKLGLFGGALVGVAGLAVKRFADFDAAMSKVAATGDDAKQNIDALRQAAMDAGAETVFSASEAAGAIEELSKAGVSAADVLGGGLTGALNLAAAGSLEVADAAEIAATAMTQFGLGGDDVTHIADLLAAGAGKAQGGVGDLGFALKQSGLVASQFGLSVDETVGTLTAFAKGGLLGSDAGTSFRTMLLRMANPSKEAAERMKDLHVAAYDSTGAFVGMASLAGQLKAALEPLPQAERDAALATIFGSDAIRAANILYAQGEQGIAGWIDKVDDQGYAAKVAAEKMNNLKGDLENFTGSLETALIGAGSGANDGLRSLVQGATAVVNAFGELPDAAQQATLGIVGGTGLVALGTAGLVKLVTGGIEVVNTLKTIGVTAKTAAIAVGGVSAVIAAATIGVTLWATANAEADAKIQDLAGTLDAQTGALTENTSAWVSSELTKNQSFGINNTKSMADAAEELGVSLETLTKAYLGQPGAIQEAKDAAQEWYDANHGVDAALSGKALLFTTFNKNLDDQANRLRDAKEITETKIEVDAQAAEAQGELGGEYDTTTGTIDDQTESLADLIKAQQDAAGIVSSDLEAQAALQQAYADASESIAKNKDTLDIHTQAGRDNQAALLHIKDATWDVIASKEADKASTEELQASMKAGRDSFISYAKAMGMSTEDAKKLADQLGLIPENITSTVTVGTTGLPAAQTGIEKFISKNANRSITIHTYIDVPKSVPLPGQGRGYGVVAPRKDSARGNLYAFDDGGGIDGNGNPVARVPQIRPGGGNVLWAEPSTGWEAYISGKPGAHARNVSILSQAASRLGYAVTQLEDGGSYGYGAAVAASAPVTVDLPDGMRLTGQLDLGNGLSGFVDARVSAGLTADRRASVATRSTKGTSW